jgi:hypothetical protein
MLAGKSDASQHFERERMSWLAEIEANHLVCGFHPGSSDLIPDIGENQARQAP